jgi:tetratricopeptide (TPR) repeat protein
MVFGVVRMKLPLVLITFLTLMLLPVVLPHANVPAQQTQRNSETEELNEALRLKHLAVELFDQGKYDEALAPAQRALEIEQRLLGPTHPRVAVALNNLAEIYLGKKKDNEAEKLFQEAVGIFEKEGERNADRIGIILERLAMLRFQHKDYAKAAALLERSLTLKRKTLGNENAKIAETLFELAIVYQWQRNYERAEPLFFEALKMKEKVLGASDPNTVKAMKDFACANLFSQVGLQKKIPLAVVDPTDENQAIVARAYCWIGELDDGCADSAGNKFGGAQGLLNGKALSMPKPSYPPEARFAGASGSIFVAVLLDEGGNVIKARSVCNGHPLLTGVSLAAAREAKFTPTSINGKPIKAMGIITYRFVRQ